MQDKPQTRQRTNTTDRLVDAEIRAHDADVLRADVDIWVGAEPTFTLARSESLEWLSEALGSEKNSYGLRMAAALRERHPGCAVLRTVGRQYAGEPVPRWSLGLLERRDGVPVWSGPADPLGAATETPRPDALDGLCETLQRQFSDHGWGTERLCVPDSTERRLLFRIDAPLGAYRIQDERLLRPSLHEIKTPHDGLSDTLAAEGLMLITIGRLSLGPDTQTACVELPHFADVEPFLDCLAAIASAAGKVGLGHLVLQGFPPPVDARLAWTTITPDPAVIEVNQAPQASVQDFSTSMRELFDVARSLGLSPCRLQYNGTISDSGGGGQFTLGGRTAMDSPFFAHPVLLPRLIRYCNNHPALSYLFAPDYLGAASQSPRPDEGTRETYRELEVALEQLAAEPSPGREVLWASLAPFLADTSGNAHRSELNIEKLWNPHLPGRGCLGVVEFRAFRMPDSPERAAAIAALLRGIAAMLSRADPAPRLCDWGDTLHDQYALPWFLRQDLHRVLDDLAAHGLAIGAQLQATLLHDASRSRWRTEFGGCEFVIENALEFWPLVGDVASQEAGGSRLVDSSTLRLQVSLCETAAVGLEFDHWQLQVARNQVPLREVAHGPERTRLLGLRYRDFTPWRGLHPAIPPQGPLVFTLSHPALDDALRVTLHGWRPDGLAYHGLPSDPAEAAARRAERLVTSLVPRHEVAVAILPPPGAVTDYTLDLRRLPRRR